LRVKRCPFDALIRRNPEKIIVLLIDNLDFTAFTSVWFWVILVLVWAVTSQYILGVPFSDLQRASKADAEAQEEALTRLLAQAQRVAPPAIAAVRLGLALGAGFAVGFWAVAGFGYSNEALQALFLLVVPLWPVLLLRLRFARSITGARPDFAQVYIKLRWIRFWTFCIGVLTIFLTAFWGMIFNINKLVL
tara:strand:- start:355 stop:927 length:573 start_codon:yes stop_codon:yes gene_type:complete